MRRALLVCLALCAAVLVVYGQTLGYDFIDGFDDHPYVTGNPQVCAGLTGDSLVWALTTPVPFYWHPMTWTSHMLDVEVFGLRAGGHHLTNVLLHLANTLLVLLVLNRLTRAFWRSAFVAGVFALHPTCVEAVAYVAQRKDLLSTLFLLLTTWAYVGYARRGGAWRYGLVAALLALGLTAKPMLVTLPLALLLLDYWPLGRFGASPPTQDASAAHDADATDTPRPTRAPFPWRPICEKLPLLALALAVSVVTMIGATRTGGTPDTSVVPLIDRVDNAVVSYATYIGMTFWPTRLAVLYPHPSLVGVTPLGSAQIALSALLLVAVSCVAIALRHRRPYVLVGWLWFVGTLVPVIGLVVTGHQALTDRYLYVPMLGLAVIVAWGLSEWAHRSRYAHVACAAVATTVLVVLAGAAWAQTRYWRDTRTLFDRALAVTENNWPVYNILGSESYADGDYVRAIALLRRVLDLNPYSDDAHYNMGLALAQLDEPEAAVSHLERAEALAPTAADVPYALGHLLSGEDRPAEAAAALRRSLALDPDSAPTHYELGIALARLGDHAPAVTHLERALAIAPRLSGVHHVLGVLETRLGRLTDGVRHLRQAARIDPQSKAVRRSLALALSQQRHASAARTD